MWDWQAVDLNKLSAYDIEVSDNEKRLKAVEDISKLYEISGSSIVKKLLKKVYEESDKGMKKLAGRTLGYSGLRIWWEGLRG